jgi:hypothetical protein
MKKSHGLNSDLLRFLAEAGSYPHKPEQVEHIQTHISHVFMVPPFVYKIKKPVNFGFLDYSTLKKRHEFCRREVELNRRLCDGVYLGVVAIVKENEKFKFVPENEAPDSVFEYAVKMRQLSEEHFLHSLIKEGKLDRQHLDRVADKLADFYRQQKPENEILKWGRIENVRVNTDENFNQTKQFINKTIDRNTYEAIKRFTNRYYEQNEDQFRQRILDGRIVDGHGDLHLEHVHITPEQVRIYDCIEFNDRFRYGDLAADLAYLAMDLDFNNLWNEERYFIDRMSRKLEDHGLWRIIDFYKCYRAFVKGKVKSLQQAEEEVAPKDRKQAMKLARRYFDLSLRYALIGSKPMALIFMGRVGTGKSTLSEHLGRKLGIHHFSSDRIRKTMARVPLTKRVSPADREVLYSSEMSGQTYGKLMEKAVRSIEKRECVILDATFSSREGRQQLVKLLEERDANYCFIEVLASDKTIKERLKSRKQKKDVISDARLEDFERLSKNYSPPRELSADHLIKVKTEQTLDASVRQLYVELAERNLKNWDSH